ncbi:NAD(P)H-binding protein [Pedobacter caeni]|uniref:Uncharacterized conserved protein YbjT, contains NAD(P)-binding and DUF2867 domains n=1 Tax=Pedobacter caeni TaxID=288992 RepID=A0A1M5HLR9_9SPHI|nr:NAD(P)H-binding protein [Pedobacter caeni]SHG16899.1 Uncharacterized conserved protein YbjT, contains NAD(P)-binding and DUF2867 domains [Pedobacter caeni]
MEEKNILVIGGKGKNGRRVVAKLRAKLYNVFSTTRSKERLEENESYFDWNDSSTYAPALKNINKVYIVHPDTSMPEAQGQLKELVAQLVQQPISKVVLLSGRGQESVEKCEEMLMNSPQEWTIVRSAWFNQNFSEGHFGYGIKSGELAFMAGPVKEPFVDLDDLTDVVVEALIHEKHNGKIYEVTGPELFSFEEAVIMIGSHLDCDIKYKFYPKDEYKYLLLNAGLPAAVADHMVHAFAEILDGRNANIGDGIQQVLGRNPKKFIDFVRSNQF